MLHFIVCSWFLFLFLLFLFLLFLFLLFLLVLLPLMMQLKYTMWRKKKMDIDKVVEFLTRTE